MQPARVFQPIVALPVAAVIWMSLASNVVSQSEYELAKVVTERQRKMLEMQNAFWPLFNLKNGKSTDLVAAADATKRIDEVFVEFLALLPEGTARGEVPGSRARPEIWTEPSQFNAAVEGLRSATAKLQEVALSGSVVDFQEEFETFNNACFACHEFKPSAGGAFRSPRDDSQ